MDFATQIYTVTQTLPTHETYGIRSQIRRAATSIPCNIAEGEGRGTPREMLRYCAIAYGSLSEVETLIELCNRLHYLQQADADNLRENAAEIGRLINGLRRSKQA